MNIIRIPTKFELARVRVDVENIEYTSKESLGFCSNADSKIVIANQSRRVVQSQLKKLNTFYHELAHMYFMTMDRQDLYDDEVLCTALGNLMMEFDITRDELPIRAVEPIEPVVQPINANRTETVNQLGAMMIDGRNIETYLTLVPYSVVKEAYEIAGNLIPESNREIIQKYFKL